MNINQNTPFVLQELPFDPSSFGDAMCKDTFAYHHGKHHAAYVNKLNSLVKGTEYEGKDLEDVVKSSYKKEDAVDIFNNAAQIWNHNFLWNSISPVKMQVPENLKLQIEKDFGSYDEFVKEFHAAGITQFGSGWVWLVCDCNDGNKLKIVKTSNAHTPLTDDVSVLLTCDVWEHAYYIDHKNNRANYLKDFIEDLVNWEFAAKNFENART